MNKLITGSVAGLAIAGGAAAYMPIKVGNTVQSQLQQAVQATNAQPGNSFQIEITDYQKSAYSSEVITRIILKDQTGAISHPDDYIELRHKIDHGISSATFKSNVVVTENIKTIVDKDFNGIVPVRFDGEISVDTAVVNSYLDAFTLKPEGPHGGEIKVKPANMRLTYQIDPQQYQLQGTWNGADLNASSDHLSLGSLKIKASGNPVSDYIWRYQSHINLERFDFGNNVINLNSQQLQLSDNFDIEKNTEGAESISYNSTITLNSLSASQHQQSMLELKPSEISYVLSGPTVSATEALIEASQQMQTDQMTQQDAQKVFPLFADFIQMLNLDIHTLDLATPDGSINGNLNLSLDANTQELLQAFSFAPLLTQFVMINSDLNISKSLVEKISPLQALAAQLNQRGAYREVGEDMVLKARLKDGQLVLNDVSF